MGLPDRASLRRPGAGKETCSLRNHAPGSLVPCMNNIMTEDCLKEVKAGESLLKKTLSSEQVVQTL